MTDKTTRPPKDNVFRAVYPGLELRSEETDGGDERPVLSGHFARFGEWTEIDSVWEGRFLERLDPGAFKKTIKENRDAMRVLFQHGRDPQIGDKPLGPIRELREDSDGVYYEVPLLDTAYNRDLEPGLRAGLYGASFRFSVVKEDFEAKPKRSGHNPDGLPERVIKEARVMEFGPVTFPAYAGATAGVRSITDDIFFDQIAKDPERLRALMERRGDIHPPHVEAALPADGADASHSDEGSRSEPLAQADGHSVTKAWAEGLKSPPPAVAAPTPPEDPPVSGSSVRSPSVNTIEERLSRISEIEARFQEINAEHGVNVLPEATQSEWDQLTEEREGHQKAIKAWEDRQSVLSAASTNERNVERVGEKTQTRTSASTGVPANIYELAEYRGLSSSPERERAAIREGAMRAVEIASFPHEAADDAKNKEQIAKLLATDEEGTLARHILATGNPIYQRAFMKTIAGKMLSSEEQRAIQTVGTTTTGGFNVPFTLDPTLVLTSDGSVNPLRQMARVERLTQGNTWKGVTTAGVTITRGPAEMQPVTPTEITFGQPEVTVQPVKVEIQFSIEADEDWPRLQQELARVLNEAKDDEEADSFVNGVGTTVFPEGVAAGLDASSDVGTTGNGLDVADLYRLEGSLPPKHRARAQFLANKAVYSQIRQFSVGTTGEGSVWTRGLAVGDPAQLLGYPAREVSTMESDPTADGERIMLFGDFRAGFIIVDKVGMTIEIDPHVRNGDGKWVGARALLAHYRNSSLVINDNALRALVVGVVTS